MTDGEEGLQVAAEGSDGARCGQERVDVVASIPSILKQNQHHRKESEKSASYVEVPCVACNTDASLDGDRVASRVVCVGDRTLSRGVSSCSYTYCREHVRSCS